MPKGRFAQPRLPFDPVMRHYQGRSLRAIGTALGVSWNAITQWQDRGIPLDSADRIAVKSLGVHPSALWGDLWWEATPIVS